MLQARARLRHVHADLASLPARGHVGLIHAPEGPCRFYFPGGRFDPARALRRIEASAARALEMGFAGLRAVSHVPWPGAGQGWDLPVADDYEARLDQDLLPRLPMGCMCLCDRRRFSPPWQDMVSRHHPALLSGAGLLTP